MDPLAPPPFNGSSSLLLQAANDNETIINDDSSSQIRMPIFIGVGLGTTGTTSLYESMCRLGVPSAHWHKSCGQHKNLSAVLLDPSSIQMGQEAHHRIRHTYIRLKECAQQERQQRKNTGLLTCPTDRNQLIQQLFDDAEIVVQSGLAFLADTPYPYLLPHLLRVAQKVNRLPVLLLTERDPKEWVSRRVNVHDDASDIMCMHHDLEHAFDLEACLLKEEDNDKNSTTKLFIVHEEKENDKDYNAFLESAMKRYHRNIKNMDRVVTFNLWTESLADPDSLEEAIKIRLKQVLPKPYVEYFLEHTSGQPLIHNMVAKQAPRRKKKPRKQSYDSPKHLRTRY